MEFAMFDKQRNSRFGQSEAKGNVPESAQGSASSQVESPTQSTRSVAMIGTGIQINGDISGDENLVIDGKVEGSVKLDSNEVSVGQGGRVKADVSARIVRVDGRLDGDITGQEKVIISKSGNVRGNIKAPRVLLEDGAIFKGSIDMDPEVVPEQPAATKKKTNGKTLGSGTQPMKLEAGTKDSAYSSAKSG
jgi:cytoskeletal protein CcmA (bactofilin family)